MWIPHSSFWPCQRPERGLFGSRGGVVHGSHPILVWTTFPLGSRNGSISCRLARDGDWSRRSAVNHTSCASSAEKSGPTLCTAQHLSLIHISEPTRQAEISYAVFCLKKKKTIK